MIEESGIVVADHGRLADVESRRRVGGCGGCATSGSCGTALLERWLGSKPLQVRARNPVGARLGEPVVLGIPESALLQASFVAYVLPLLAMIACAIAVGAFAELVFPPWAGGLSALGGVLGLGVGLGWLAVYNRRRSRQEGFGPVILRRDLDAPVRVDLRREIGRLRHDTD